MSEKVKLVVCNEPQNCGTVKELEAEVKRLKEQLKKASQDEFELTIQEADTYFTKEYWKKRAESAESRLAEALGVLEEAPFPDVAQFGQFCSCFHLWKKELEKALGGAGGAGG